MRRPARAPRLMRGPMRGPMSGLMSGPMSALASLAGLAALAALAACGGPSTAPPPSATPVPSPPAHACHQLTYDEAIAATASGATVPCDRPHTSQTYAVGSLPALADGHLLAVDSDRVGRQVARTCRARLARFAGGSGDALRLSVLRPVWFTPTVTASDRGAAWFRCDVVAVAGSSTLARLSGSLRGALGSGDAWALCGTAPPGAPDAMLVPCAARHSWRALSVVPLPAGPYPGETAVRQAGQATCKGAARDVAKDALQYQWAYEWPTAEQWAAGQTYGRCWAPV